MDGDGLLDRVDTLGETVTYSDSSKPYLLIEVFHGTGAVTELSYLPASAYTATNEPSQHAPGGWVLASVLTSEELYGLQSTLTTYGYAGGRSVDGVFEGWLTTTTRTTTNDDVPVDVETEYELSSIYPPAPALRQVWTEPERVSSYQDGAGETMTLRSGVDTSYTVVGSRQLVDGETVHVYGDAVGTAPIVTEVDYTWSADGDLLTYTHDGGGDPADRLEMRFDYVTDGSGVVRRIVRKESWGVARSPAPSASTASMSTATTTIWRAKLATSWCMAS